jgi:NADP-dependent 3-hydroxy acid dehydrogenase YdfG
MAKVWLITGSGNGLGRDIAEAALAAGDSVVAGARRTEELASLVTQYGARVKPVTLEVREEAAAKAAVRADECGGFPGRRGYMLLRGGVHNTRCYPSDA